MQNISPTDYRPSAAAAGRPGKEELHMGRKTITWRGMIFITAAMLLLFAVGMVRVVGQRRDMESLYDERQAKIVVREQEVSALKNELARVGTDGYVENEARGRYEYVRDGELRFEFADPGKLSHYTEAEWNIIMEEGLYTTY